MLIPKEEMHHRFYEAQKIILERNLSAMFFMGDHMPGDGDPGDFHYFVNHHVLNYRQCVLLFPNREPILLSGGWIQTQAAKQYCKIKDCRQFSPTTELIKLLPRVLEENGVTQGQVGTNLDYVSVAIEKSLKQALPDVELVEVHDAIFCLRQQHSEEETRHMRRCAEICDGAYERILEIAKPGVTENKIRAELEHYMITNGVQNCFNLVSSGRYSIDPEKNDLLLPYTPEPIFKRLRFGDTLMLEITPQFDGYWSQLVRYLSIGERNPELELVYGLTRGAIHSGLKEIRPGNTIGNLALAMDQYIATKTDSFKLANCLGHTCGLDLTEYVVTRNSQVQMQPGMAIIVHPSIVTRDGKCEIFTGETYLVTETGFECLMKTDENLYTL